MPATRSRPLLAVTMGDPAGIGPEVALRAARSPSIRRIARVAFVGDPAVFDETARRIGVPIGAAPVLAVSKLPSVARRPGRPTAAGAEAAFDSIVEAVGIVRSGQADAIVTAPVSKEAIQKTGRAFRGHTELIAELSEGADVRMMMSAKSLRVILVTTHMALADLPGALTSERIYETIAIAARSLRTDFGFVRPRIGVAGWNPHAGEGGAFGAEDRQIVAPAVRRARRLRARVTGPHPPDTVFVRARNGELDAVVALYHDQGLIPFKLLHFHDGVNVTIGLPFPRTSPDHGTAFDLAGRGDPDWTSMREAMSLAARMVTR